MKIQFPPSGVKKNQKRRIIGYLAIYAYLVSEPILLRRNKIQPTVLWMYLAPVYEAAAASCGGYLKFQGKQFNFLVVTALLHFEVEGR